nr:(d)CMP kinase [Clostridia bacterium]
MSENTNTKNKLSEVRIAVDGPSGAGKGELATRLAERLGLVYLDTGALYRAVGLYVYRKGISKDDTAAVIDILDDIEVHLERNSDGDQVVLLNGENVNSLIRQDIISTYASAVSQIPEVRRFLDRIQRDAAKAGAVVMDGRDIGTVIMPDAKLKIYLTASLEERARRRYQQQLSKGYEADYEDILKRMRERDHNDSTRDVAPAVASSDAQILDNTHLSIEATVERAVELAKIAYGDIIA